MDEIQGAMNLSLFSKDYISIYSNIFEGDEKWNLLESPQSDVFDWSENSSYIKEAPFFKDISAEPETIPSIHSARVLLKLGDSITTDHISPAGSIGESSAE